ncbi:uncharacterized protein [Rutidosis leptorrhynchoides]|uniref:uncharacterized protein n=1 Tax=Rutidosis leptorrhynchoides TaxID=125765 RepID=UPI003A9973A2
MLEAVASQDLWIWHGFFGMAGANNDINVLNASPLFNSIKGGTAPPSPFDVNGHHYDRGYYLGDGIYLDWAMLVKAPYAPLTNREKNLNGFKKVPEKILSVHLEYYRVDLQCRRGERMIERNPPRRLQRDLRDRDAKVKEIRDRQVHRKLEAYLTQHVWNLSPYFRNASDE